MANILGAKWKALTPEQKKPYEENYGALGRRAEVENSNGVEAMKLLEKEKDPLKPKCPESAYFLFINERHAALVAERKSLVEITKITREEWKNMTKKQKALYEKVAQTKSKKYTQKIDVYKQNKEEEAENAKKEEAELFKVLKQECEIMPPKKAPRTRTKPATTTNTTSVTKAQLQAMIDQGVAITLATRDANKSTNGEDIHNSGTELALLYVRMFSEESDKIEKYVGGLPDMIYGSVMASRPKTMQDAIEMATELMDKKISTLAERQAANKRKLDNNNQAQ
ncbi:reverse transcriptase domain-containing protein [Tanacetum coccineum]